MRRGITLLECMLAVLIAGTTIISVLEVRANTTNDAFYASYNRLGAMLANELLVKESIGNFPETTSTESDASSVVGEEQSYYNSSETEVDTSIFGEQYKGFSYEVSKSYIDIDVDTELSDNDEEDEEDLTDDEEEEESPTVRLVKIVVTVFYPLQPGEEERYSFSVSTYVKPPDEAASTTEESADTD